MKNKLINGRWNMIVPDSIADWDGGTGNHADRQGWEFCRFESFDRHLRRGMRFIDVGAEHGWITAVLAKHYVGAENMILVEPSPEFWTNIRLIWEHNELPMPEDIVPAFVAAEPYGDNEHFTSWPSWTDGAEECPAMAYRSLAHHAHEVPTTTIDRIARRALGPIDAINIDIEGAEMLAIQGGLDTLLHDRPLVWISVHPDLMARDFGVERCEDLFDLMHSLGYGREYLGTDHEQHHAFFPLEYTGPAR